VLLPPQADVNGIGKKRLHPKGRVDQRKEEVKKTEKGRRKGWENESKRDVEHCADKGGHPSPGIEFVLIRAWSETGIRERRAYACLRGKMNSVTATLGCAPKHLL
jgi:hypothetical protein